jgi:hypothetical protein
MEMSHGENYQQLLPSHGNFIRVQDGADITKKEDDINDDDDLLLSKWMWKVDCGVLRQYDYNVYATIQDTHRLSEK